MTDISDIDSRRLLEIFMPTATRRRVAFKEANGRFAHYTSAENAINIIRGRRVWMRNAKCMNDFMEVDHGFDNLVGYFEKNHTQFYALLDSCCNGAAKEAVDTFDKWYQHVRTNTFVTCLSEHENDEDRHGRLSMWRAYNKGAVGVALIFKNDPFYIEEAVGIYSSPVLYFTGDGFQEEMQLIVQRISENKDFLCSVPKEILSEVIFNMLLFSSVCTKHPGFREEREWRIIHVPGLHDAKNVLEDFVELVAGVPQSVKKIRLIDVPEQGYVGVSPDKLIDRIIIGPSSFPSAIYEAFVKELAAAGVDDAPSKVIVSDIPLRT